MFTGREAPVVVSAKAEFLGHLDTVIGERSYVLEFSPFNSISVVFPTVTGCD